MTINVTVNSQIGTEDVQIPNCKTGAMGSEQIMMKWTLRWMTLVRLVTMDVVVICVVETLAGEVMTGVSTATTCIEDLEGGDTVRQLLESIGLSRRDTAGYS